MHWISVKQTYHVTRFFNAIVMISYINLICIDISDGNLSCLSFVYALFRLWYIKRSCVDVFDANSSRSLIDSILLSLSLRYPTSNLHAFILFVMDAYYVTDFKCFLLGYLRPTSNLDLWYLIMFKRWYLLQKLIIQPILEA